MKSTFTLLESAQDAAQVAETWADLSNFLFSPKTGLVARAYPAREDRKQFLQSEEYRAIRKLVEDARDRTGLVAGATPAKTKSGKFIVRLPKTLHAALEAEATEEGVSLNQLVVAKLALRMSRLVKLS